MKFSSVFIFRISCFYYVRSRGHKNNQQSTQHSSISNIRWMVRIGAWHLENFGFVLILRRNLWHANRIGSTIVGFWLFCLFPMRTCSFENRLVVRSEVLFFLSWQEIWPFIQDQVAGNSLKEF